VVQVDVAGDLAWAGAAGERCGHDVCGKAVMRLTLLGMLVLWFPCAIDVFVLCICSSSVTVNHNR
jgi:hypothetical protein